MKKSESSILFQKKMQPSRSSPLVDTESTDLMGGVDSDLASHNHLSRNSKKLRNSEFETQDGDSCGSMRYQEGGEQGLGRRFSSTKADMNEILKSLEIENLSSQDSQSGYRELNEMSQNLKIVEYNKYDDYSLEKGLQKIHQKTEIMGQKSDPETILTTKPAAAAAWKPPRSLALSKAKLYSPIIEQDIEESEMSGITSSFKFSEEDHVVLTDEVPKTPNIPQELEGMKRLIKNFKSEVTFLRTQNTELREALLDAQSKDYQSSKRCSESNLRPRNSISGNLKTSQNFKKSEKFEQDLAILRTKERFLGCYKWMEKISLANSLRMEKQERHLNKCIKNLLYLKSIYLYSKKRAEEKTERLVEKLEKSEEMRARLLTENQGLSERVLGVESLHMRLKERVNDMEMRESGIHQSQPHRHEKMIQQLELKYQESQERISYFARKNKQLESDIENLKQRNHKLELRYEETCIQFNKKFNEFTQKDKTRRTKKSSSSHSNNTKSGMNHTGSTSHSNNRSSAQISQSTNQQTSQSSQGGISCPSTSNQVSKTTPSCSTGSEGTVTPTSQRTTEQSVKQSSQDSHMPRSSQTRPTRPKEAPRPYNGNYSSESVDFDFIKTQEISPIPSRRRYESSYRESCSRTNRLKKSKYSSSRSRGRDGDGKRDSGNGRSSGNSGNRRQKGKNQSRSRSKRKNERGRREVFQEDEGAYGSHFQGSKAAGGTRSSQRTRESTAANTAREVIQGPSSRGYDSRRPNEQRPDDHNPRNHEERRKIRNFENFEDGYYRDIDFDPEHQDRHDRELRHGRTAPSRQNFSKKDEEYIIEDHQLKTQKDIRRSMKAAGRETHPFHDENNPEHKNSKSRSKSRTQPKQRKQRSSNSQRRHQQSARQHHNHFDQHSRERSKENRYPSDSENHPKGEARGEEPRPQMSNRRPRRPEDHFYPRQRDNSDQIRFINDFDQKLKKSKIEPEIVVNKELREPSSQSNPSHHSLSQQHSPHHLEMARRRKTHRDLERRDSEVSHYPQRPHQYPQNHQRAQDATNGGHSLPPESYTPEARTPLQERSSRLTSHTSSRTGAQKKAQMHPRPEGIENNPLMTPNVNNSSKSKQSSSRDPTETSFLLKTKTKDEKGSYSFKTGDTIYKLQREIFQLKKEKIEREREYMKTRSEMEGIKKSLKNNQKFLISLKDEMSGYHSDRYSDLLVNQVTRTDTGSNPVSEVLRSLKTDFEDRVAGRGFNGQEELAGAQKELLVSVKKAGGSNFGEFADFDFGGFEGVNQQKMGEGRHPVNFQGRIGQLDDRQLDEMIARNSVIFEDREALQLQTASRLGGMDTARGVGAEQGCGERDIRRRIVYY